MKKVIDGFIWLLVTNKAKEVWQTGLFDVYVLHKDKSESLVESYADINDALECGLDIAIEVGHEKDVDTLDTETLQFKDGDKEMIVLLLVTGDEFWVSAGNYDICYSNQYKQILVYRKGDENFKLIHSQEIKTK